MHNAKWFPVQVLVAILSGALWVPYLDTFPVILLLATVTTFILALIITKIGPLRLVNLYFSLLFFKQFVFRYLFGLPTPKGSCIPGKICQRFVPCILLGISAIVIWLSVYLYAILIFVKVIPWPTPVPPLENSGSGIGASNKSWQKNFICCLLRYLKPRYGRLAKKKYSLLVGPGY